MDVKLRSLICMGLNEQVLHLWLEVLGSSINTIQKWLVFKWEIHHGIMLNLYVLSVKVLSWKFLSQPGLGAGEVRLETAVAVPVHT